MTIAVTNLLWQKPVLLVPRYWVPSSAKAVTGLGERMGTWWSGFARYGLRVPITNQVNWLLVTDTGCWSWSRRNEEWLRRTWHALLRVPEVIARQVSEQLALLFGRSCSFCTRTEPISGGDHWFSTRKLHSGNLFRKQLKVRVDYFWV